MKVSHGIRFIVLVLMLATVSSAEGQGQAYQDGAPPSVDESEAPVETGKLGLHYQVGGFLRAVTSYDGSGPGDYMLTVDLALVKWSRTKSTLGFGVRYSLDDDANRFGVKGLWRTPLHWGKSTYFQLAPGVHVWGNDAIHPFKIPGYFLEAELGLNHWFALVSSVEINPYEQSDSNDQVTSGVATSLYLGAKVGQKPALIASAVGIVVGVIAAGISLQNSFN